MTIADAFPTTIAELFDDLRKEQGRDADGQFASGSGSDSGAKSKTRTITVKGKAVEVPESIEDGATQAESTGRAHGAGGRQVSLKDLRVKHGTTSTSSDYAAHPMLPELQAHRKALNAELKRHDKDFDAHGAYSDEAGYSRVNDDLDHVEKLIAQAKGVRKALTIADLFDKAAKKPAGGAKGKFDESKHPRAKDGEFGSGGAGAASKPKPGARNAAVPKTPTKTSAKTVAAGAAKFQAPQLPGAMFAPGAGNVKAPKATTKLKATPNRAFTGEPVALKTQLDKPTTGRIGEGIAIAFLQQAGMTDARPANSTIPNFPVDVLGNTSCIEIKTGLVSNSKGAQQWRATIGEPGPKEKLLLAKMSPEKKKAWNAQKRQDIMDRKAAVIKAQGKLAGKTYKARTVTILINPDTKTADVHVMDGFHSRIGWTDARSKASYVGSFKYA